MTGDPIGVLDTNTLVLIDRLDPEELPGQAVITTVTLAELSVGPLTATNEVERVARLVLLQRVEAAFEPIPFDAAAARAFGGVAASLHRAGRKVAARAFDTLIAAIAVANDLPLYTCNPRDFVGIEGLRVHAVPHPDQVEDDR